jgi:hypothetical protein
MSDFIYLASQSPRRRQLLEQIGVKHELLLPDADEDAEALELVHPGESPVAYVARVTALKLDAAVARMKRRGLAPAPVLCSDTTVALGRIILGKPGDASEARHMLQALSGTSGIINWVSIAPQETRVACGRETAPWCRSCMSSARWSAGWWATSTSARCARAARHAVGLHRHRAGARRLPARGHDCLAPAGEGETAGAPRPNASALPIERQVFEGQSCWCR